MNQEYVDVLKQEIELIKSRFEDHDTGHLKTTVFVLEERVKELQSQIKNV
jgi:hypothetical protein